MPLFLIERQFAELVPTDPESLATVKRVNDEIGIQWLFSFLSADKRKTYCLAGAERRCDPCRRGTARRACRYHCGSGRYRPACDNGRGGPRAGRVSGLQVRPIQAAIAAGSFSGSTSRSALTGASVATATISG